MAITREVAGWPAVSTGGDSRTIGKLVDRSPKQQSVELYRSTRLSRAPCFVTETLRGDPAYKSWASKATRVRQNVGDFVASDPGVGSDVVYENSMHLA